MATRSLIGLERDNNMVEYIYCHWDGDPEYLGRILKNHYNSKSKIEELLKLGSLSSLDKTIDESIFYRRDRKEDLELTKARKVDKNEFLSDSEDNIYMGGSEYRYLYTKNNEFKCYDTCEDTFVEIPN